jgi:hypothetical protein
MDDDDDDDDEQNYDDEMIKVVLGPRKLII